MIRSFGFHHYSSLSLLSSSHVLLYALDLSFWILHCCVDKIDSPHLCHPCLNSNLHVFSLFVKVEMNEVGIYQKSFDFPSSSSLVKMRQGQLSFCHILSLSIHSKHRKFSCSTLNTPKRKSSSIIILISTVYTFMYSTHSTFEWIWTFSSCLWWDESPPSPDMKHDEMTFRFLLPHKTLELLAPINLAFSVLFCFRFIFSLYFLCRNSSLLSSCAVVMNVIIHWMNIDWDDRWSMCGMVDMMKRAIASKSIIKLR